MVASTDIKFYVHTNNNAPQLTNNFGCMIDVLDACLVNGFGSQTVATLTASGTTVTATFGAAHNFMQYQVIKIAGANQTEFNGEHRILTVPNANTITFQLASAPSVSTATGAMTCLLPPLGWSKPFSAAGKAAYRSNNILLPSRPYLRVVDALDPAYTSTFAKYAKVGIVEDMTDIDTMLGVQAPYDSANPDKNWVGTGSGQSVINGWARWYYACSTESTNASYSIDYQAPTNGSVQWVLIGTKDHFYIIPEVRVGYSAGLVYGFGSFDSLIPIDNANTFLSATLSANAANSTTFKRATTSLSSTYPNCCILLRNYTQAAIYATAFTKSLLDNFHSGNANQFVSDSTAGITAFDVFLLENGNVMRGKLPLLKFLYSQTPYTNMSTVTFGPEIYFSKTVATGNTSTGNAQVILKVGDLA